MYGEFNSYIRAIRSVRYIEVVHSSVGGFVIEVPLYIKINYILLHCATHPPSIANVLPVT